MFARIRNSDGSTMIEILVAAVIFGIIVVPIFDAMVRGRVLSAHRGEKRMALRLVERKAEQLLKAGYGSVDAGADVTSVTLAAGGHPSDPSIVVNTRGDADAGNDVIGDLTWTVSNAVTGSPGDSVRVKNVLVKLVWPQGAPRDSVWISTVVGS